MRKRTLTGVGTGIGISSDGKIVIQQKQESEADIEHLTGAKRKKADRLLAEIRERRAVITKDEVRIQALERLRDFDLREEDSLKVFSQVIKSEDPEKRAAAESLWEMMQEVALQNASAFSEKTPPNSGDIMRRDLVISALHAYKKASFDNLSDESLALVVDIFELVYNSLKSDNSSLQELEKYRQSLGVLDELSEKNLLDVLTRSTLEEMSKLKLGTKMSSSEEKFIKLSSQLAPEDKKEFMKHLAKGDNDGALNVVKKYPEVHAAFVESFDALLDREGLKSSAEITQILSSNGYTPKGDLNDMLFVNDQMIMKTAVDLWEQTYKINPDDHDTAFAVVREAIAFAPGDRERMGEDMLFRIHATGMFLARWAHWAFPRIMTSHTYAAALMCTSVTHEILEDLVIQWPAFEVHVPNGMLMLDGLDFDRIRVHVDERQAAFWLFCRTRTEKGNVDAFVKQSSNLADLLSDPLESNDPKDRLYFMAKRLVAGLLLAMQHTTNFKDRVVRGKQAIGEKRRPPDHRIVFVGAPIKVDARHEVQKFLTKHVRRGKAAPPSVQWLVRGHYRRQVVGVGRLGRKVIWIEPFWKGPEDAPILNRPKKLVGPQAS